MLKNLKNRSNNQGMTVSPSAAGTKASGVSCSHNGDQGNDGHQKDCEKRDHRHCDYKTCEHPPQPKPQSLTPQWLCYEGIREIVDWIRERTQIVPQIAVLTGRALGGLAEEMEEKVVFKYEEIPHFHVVGSQDFPDQMTIGKLGRKRLVVLQGRFAPYEGFHYGVSAMPVRVTRMLGATHFINLNCVSSLSPDFNVGNYVLVKDHLNLPGLCGLHPLKGTNDERLGPRFPDLKRSYDKGMREVWRQTIEEMKAADKSKQEDAFPMKGVVSKEGVAALISGPTQLTPAERTMLKTCGADVVGLSGAHENVVAQHQGFKVMQISLVARICPQDEDQPDEDEEKLREISKTKGTALLQIVVQFIKNLDIL